MKITKKKLKQVTDNYHAIEQNTSDLLGLEWRLKAIEAHLFEPKEKNQPEAPTSATNAQVEKPIEFGCWVEVMEDGDYLQKGWKGVVFSRHLRDNTVTVYVLNENTEYTEDMPFRLIKRIKSPIE